MNALDYKAPESVNRVQTGGLVLGGIAVLLAIFGAVTSPEKFLHSYIFGYMLVVGLTLGSLGILMLTGSTTDGFCSPSRRVSSRKVQFFGMIRPFRPTSFQSYTSSAARSEAAIPLESLDIGAL